MQQLLSLISHILLICRSRVSCELVYIFYFLQMQTVILTLSNVFNFIPCPENPPVKSSIHDLQPFYHIYHHLLEFIQQDQDSKYVFEELKLFLIKEEEVLGPRKFKKLIENISTVVLEYVIVKFRNQEVDRGVFCLTYFQKYVQKYMTSIINILMNFTYCLAQFFKRTYNTMTSYLIQSKQMIAAFKDSSQGEFQLLQSIFEGVYFYHSKKLSKSKSIFSDLISKATSRIHDEKMKTKELQPFTITLFILSTYFMSQTYRQLGEIDVSNYNLTQCLQFAESHLPDSEYLFALFEESVLVDNKRVKLSRIENKIERIKSLHFSSKHTSVQSSFQNSTKQSQTNFKVKTKPKKEVKFPQKTLEKELDSLFFLNQNKQYSLKKRTLKGLNLEASKRMHNINHLETEILGINSQKVSIHEHFKLDQHQEEIINIEDQKQSLKKAIKEQMWEVVHTLKLTKKLQTYLIGFKTAVEYQNTNKFYRFLCNEVSIMGQIVFFVMFKRFQSKMKRIAIRTIIYKGVRHQIQFLQHKVNGSSHIKVYYIQKNKGIDDLISVDEQLFSTLQTEPLEYYFQNYGKKLVPFRQYLNDLDQKTLFYVKLCNVKLRRRQLRRKNKLTYAKKQIFITFQQYQTDLRYTLFIKTEHLNNGLYRHNIQRIDKLKHHNCDYNIKFNKTIQDSPNPILYQSDLDSMITQHIITKKIKHLALILKIQNMFRWRISRKNIDKKRKEGMQVMTEKIHDSLFTLTVFGFNRIFFIEHLTNKYPKIIIKNVDYNSLSFINKLREKLQKTEDCQEQLKIIDRDFMMKNIYRKLTRRSKQLQLQLQNSFLTKIKTSLCFAKKVKQILYKDRKVEVAAMFMLTVRDFQVCPRTYVFRVFNLQAQSLYSFDIDLKIQMQDKLFLQNNFQKISDYVNIISYKQAIILNEGPAKSIPKSRRINSKSTILSNYSFGSGEDFGKQNSTKQRLITRLQNRGSCACPRNKKNSINFKHRHKSALKQKDIVMIRKWIEDCRESIKNVSEESEVSNQKQ